MATFVQGRRCFTSIREQQLQPQQVARCPSLSQWNHCWLLWQRRLAGRGEDETTSCHLWRTWSLAASTVLNWPAVWSYVQSWKSTTLRSEATRSVRDRKMVAAPPQSFAFSLKEITTKELTFIRAYAQFIFPQLRTIEGLSSFCSSSKWL